MPRSAPCARRARRSPQLPTATDCRNCDELTNRRPFGRRFFVHYYFSCINKRARMYIMQEYTEIIHEKQKISG
jgi:hypothetical protein